MAESDGKSPETEWISASFEAMLTTWRDAWLNAAGTMSTPNASFAELLARVPAIGPLREHAQTWREVAEAQAECERLEKELRAVLAGVQQEALDRVQARVRELKSTGHPIGELRELHKLWVECGEQVYAKVAHSEAYCRLQAEFGNATLRLRAQQQKVIEQWLKQFDLPTRAELNTVHRQLQEQKAKLREHKELLAAFIERMNAPITSLHKTGAPKIDKQRKPSGAASRRPKKRAAR